MYGCSFCVIMQYYFPCLARSAPDDIIICHNTKIKFSFLIILLKYFKVTLRMIAYRTYFRSFCSHCNMSQLLHSHTFTSDFSNTCAVSIFLSSLRYLSSCCFSISPTARNFAASSGNPSSSAVFAKSSLSVFLHIYSVP